MVAIAATACGQLTTVKEILFPGHKNEITYIYANNHEEMSRIESWMHDLSTWATRKGILNTSEMPVYSKTFYVDNLEVNYDESLNTEEWMTEPFETGVAEEPLQVEEWMAVPFESSNEEQNLVVEEWMTAPFTSSIGEKELEVEAWMTAPFNASEVAGPDGQDLSARN